MQEDRSQDREKILLKIREASEFPAMAKTINIVNEFRASEDATVAELTNIILKDFALTTKILKVVNSVYYFQAGEVTTITRAIFLMGFEAVKNIALTLLLFDQLYKNSTNVELIEALSRSFLGSLIAQKIVTNLNISDDEEVFLCALLNPLGKIMVAFSMPEKAREVRKYARERKISEETASGVLLGISYEDIGTVIAREWNYPDRIVRGMKSIDPKNLSQRPSDSEKIAGVVTFSASAAAIFADEADDSVRTAAIKKLAKTFEGVIRKDIEHAGKITGAALHEFRDFMQSMEIDISRTQFGEETPQTGGAATAVKQPAVPTGRTDSLRTFDAFLQGSNAPENTFAKGIQDISSSMAGEYALNGLITIALETMYRGMKEALISRAVFFVRNPREPKLEVRLGFGSSITALKRWFTIPISGDDDIFSIAVSRQDDLIIRNIDEKEIKHLVPRWFRDRLSKPAYVILLQLAVDGNNIGLYYLEGDSEGFEHISKEQFNYLRILRDQTVLGIRKLKH